MPAQPTSSISGPHLAPLTDADWPESSAHLRQGFAGQLNVYRVMAHNPPLLNAWAQFRDHVVIASALTPRQRELVILRTGFGWRAAYEWAHHVSRGRETGLTSAEIESAAEPLAPSGSRDEAQLIFSAVDALLDQGAIDPDGLAALHAALGETATLDLIATVGMYSLLAFIAKSHAVPIEPELADLRPDW